MVHLSTATGNLISHPPSLTVANQQLSLVNTIFYAKDLTSILGLFGVADFKHGNQFSQLALVSEMFRFFNFGNSTHVTHNAVLGFSQL